MFLVFLVSFRAHRKLETCPDWSPLGVKFKISDKNPHLFYMGVPPPPSCFWDVTQCSPLG